MKNRTLSLFSAFALSSLFSLPVLATQFDTLGSVLHIPDNGSLEITGDGEPGVFKTGEFLIGNGGLFSLKDNPGTDVDWFATGNIQIDGILFAPGLHLSFNTTDDLILNGTIFAASISIFSAHHVVLNTGARFITGEMFAAASQPPNVFDPVVMEVTLNSGNGNSYLVPVLNSPIVLGPMDGGSIELSGTITVNVTPVPLTGSAFYFLGALAPLVARRLRKRH